MSDIDTEKNLTRIEEIEEKSELKGRDEARGELVVHGKRVSEIKIPSVVPNDSKMASCFNFTPPIGEPRMSEMSTALSSKEKVYHSHRRIFICLKFCHEIVQFQSGQSRNLTMSLYRRQIFNKHLVSNCIRPAAM